jgi:hypothetical protein
MDSNESTAFHVASMSHAVAGSELESLKHKENCCDMLQHEKARPESQAIELLVISAKLDA